MIIIIINNKMVIINVMRIIKRNNSRYISAAVVYLPRFMFHDSSTQTIEQK